MKTAGKLLLLTAGVLPGGLAAQNKQVLPNVVYIMADDLGIGDVGCYGQREIKTPNIDRMARGGMKFLQHYSGSTVSAPSRCALLTGKDMGHAQVRGNAKVAGSDGLLYETPLEKTELTVADIFKKKQYATACVGKWGLGGPGTVGRPNLHGFDYFYGYLGQSFAHNYYPEFLHENDQKIMLHGKEYSHDLMMEKALAFIQKNAEKPFFLYFSPTIPHADLDIPQGEDNPYSGNFCEVPFPGSAYKAQENPREVYAAMVSRLDQSVGVILDKLRELGIYENTVVVFTSDNGVHAEGGHDPYFFDSNGPFRGYKRDLYEGGIRTPFVVQWPAAVKPGVVCEHISAFWDFMPTVCELIGEKVPASVNGISYLPSLTGKGVQGKHDHIYYEFFESGGKQSLMDAEGWKLIRLNVSDPSKITEEMYNIYRDPSEASDLIHQYPAQAERLRALISKCRTENSNFSFAK